MSDYNQTKKHLNKISPSVCYAKWLWSEINFNQGTTASCHLNPPHKISIVAQGHDIFNTPQKIRERQQMLLGEKPKGCDYCWKQEKRNSISDRLIKSEHYLAQGYNEKIFENNCTVIPSNLVITFDNLCNFACSYCDNSQSTTWGNIIKKGAFENITTDTAMRYQINMDKWKITATQKNNLYNKLCEYIQQHHREIKDISFLGGEPCTSPTFWKFLDFLSQLDVKHMGIKIFSNLCPGNGYNITDLKKNLSYFRSIRIHGSIENIGKSAEFTRFGTDWNKLSNNIDVLNKEGIEISLGNTISALSVLQYDKFLEWMTDFNYFKSLSAFEVVNPVFQSLAVLPEELRIHTHDNIKAVIDDHMEYFETVSGLETINSVLGSLMSEVKIDNLHDLQKDLKSFTSQYAQKTGKDVSVLGQDFVDWLKTD